MKQVQKISPNQFEHKPWLAGTNATIVQMGEALVVRLECNNKKEGHWVSFSLWEPIVVKKPENEMAAILDRSGRLIRKDGVTYESANAAGTIWPRGAFGACENVVQVKAAEKLWKEATRARIEAICTEAFPEAKKGYNQHDGGIMILLPDSKTGVGRLSAWDLDDLNDSGVDLASFLGWKVFHTIQGTGELVRLKLSNNFGDEIKPPHYAVRWRGACGKRGCKRRVTYYTQSGCHKGAWCYVVDPRTGQHLADLRNQYVVCNVHAK